jgi:hypothetical protein
MDIRDRAPSVMCFPNHDDAFRADVQASIARSRSTLSSGHELLDAVRRDLRERYPQVVVRQQDELASLDPGEERWYAYRDGRIA